MPLFSPTQVPVRENVLNSIFDRPLVAPPPQPPPPPPPRAAVTEQLGVVQHAPKTPTPRKQRRANRNAIMTTPGGDAFYSPSSSPTFSVCTSSSFRSYKSTIPVEMLSFDYVSACQSEQELLQIVTALQDDNKAPSLLRKAQSQLDHVVSSSMTSSSSGLFGRKSYLPDSSSKVGSAAKSVRWARNHTSFSPPSCSGDDEDDSLVMSLSTTFLEDSLAISSPWAGASQSSNHSRTRHLRDSNSSHQRRNGGDKSAFLQQELLKVEEERLSLERQLNTQVRTLEDRLSEAKQSNAQEQLALVEKIANLETARWSAEEKVVHLEHSVKQSSFKAQSIVTNMETVKTEADTLRTQLGWQQQQQQRSQQQAQQVEDHLRQEVASLSTQLKESANTIELREKLEAQLQHRNEIEESLQQSLQHARTKLEAIQAEETDMLTSLQQALGRDVALVPNLELSERRGLVRDVIRKLASSKAAVKAFAQAMASAEKDRYKLKEAHRLASHKVQELKRLSEKMSRENALLVHQNGTLSQDLQQAKAYAETMGQQNEDSANYQIREQEYKHTIALLKKQIRSGESVVSMSLYQQAVKEGKESQHKLKSQTAQLATLESDLAKMKVQGQRVPATSNASGNSPASRQTTPSQRRVRAISVDLTASVSRNTNSDSQPSKTVTSQRRSRAYSVDQPQQRAPTPPPPRDVSKAILAGRELVAKSRRDPTPPPRRPPPMATPSPVSSSSRSYYPPTVIALRQNNSKRLDPPESTSNMVTPQVAPPPPPRAQPVTPYQSPWARSIAAASSKPAQSKAASVSPRGLGLPRRGFGVRTEVTQTTAAHTVPYVMPITPVSCSTPQDGKSLPSQRLELDGHADKENDSPPPPPPPPAGATTQRAFNRRSSIRAGGSRKDIIQQFKKIRRSPLGNATNSSRGVAF